MPVYQLPDDHIWFPDPSEFDGDVVAVGGDLSIERLLTAYSLGIFPWYNDPGEMVWWCPADRCVLYLDQLKISHSMRNIINRKIFTVTMDKDFNGVIEGCRAGDRKHATWLLDEMADAYNELHRMGLAHSVEVWQDDKLVGGLYGVSLGHMFFGESMFSLAPNSSKAGFIFLVEHLKKLGWPMIDCQVFNPHLGSLGAVNIPRAEFLAILDEELKHDTLQRSWQ